MAETRTGTFETAAAPTPATWLADQVHRYFPEWADRPDSTSSLFEADHNSYLAGGYSEEFGYRLRSGLPPAFPLLLEDPDRSDQWAVQIGCLHPGYPECGRPAERRATHPPTRDGQWPEHRPEVRSPDRPSGSGSAARSDGLSHVVQVNRHSLEQRAPLSITGLLARFRLRLRVRDYGI